MFARSSSVSMARYGIHRAGAVADEEAEVHHLARFGRLHHEGHLGAGLFAHEVVVHRRQREQTRDRCVLFVDAAVGKDEDAVSRLDRQRCAAAEAGERAFQFLFAAVGAEEHRQRGREEIALRYAAELLQIAVGEQADRAASAYDSSAASLRGCCARYRCSWSATSPSLRGWDRWAGSSPARRAAGNN